MGFSGLSLTTTIVWFQSVNWSVSGQCLGFLVPAVDHSVESFIWCCQAWFMTRLGRSVYQPLTRLVDQQGRVGQSIER